MESNMDYIYLENWMTLLSSALGPKLLRNTFIPGSHDSNTYTVSNIKTLTSFGKCQNIPVIDQLKLGVRFLDLRYGDGSTPRSLRDKHGPLKGGDYLLHIKQVKQFLLSHPEEFIIINIQEEGNVLPINRKHLIRQLYGILNPYMITKEDLDSWFRVETVTFKQIWNTDRRILLFSTPHLWADTGISEETCAKYGIQNQKNMIISKWHDVNDIDLLLENNIKCLELKNQNKNKLFCSQFVFTIQRHPLELATNLFSFTIPTIHNFVKRLYEGSRLPRYINHNIDKNFNIMLFDYIDYDISLLKLITVANSSSKLYIHRLFVGNQDLTKVFKSKAVFNTLYLYNLNNIYEKYKPVFKAITVIYSYDDRPIRVMITSPYDKSLLVYNNPILFDKEENSIKGYLVLFKPTRVHYESLKRDYTDLEIGTMLKSKEYTKCYHIQKNQLIKIPKQG